MATVDPKEDFAPSNQLHFSTVEETTEDPVTLPFPPANDRVDLNNDQNPRSKQAKASLEQTSEPPKGSMLTRSKTKEMASSGRTSSIATDTRNSRWRATSTRTGSSSTARSSTSSARARKAVIEARIKSQKSIDDLKQKQMQERLLLEEEQLRREREVKEEQLRREREAEEEQLRREREAEEEQLRRKEEQLRREHEAEADEFYLMRKREQQELFFQQQLEQAHLQAELNEAEAELSAFDFSNAERVNMRETQTKIINDHATTVVVSSALDVKPLPESGNLIMTKFVNAHDNVSTSKHNSAQKINDVLIDVPVSNITKSSDNFGVTSPEHNVSTKSINDSRANAIIVDSNSNNDNKSHSLINAPNVTKGISHNYSACMLDLPSNLNTGIGNNAPCSVPSCVNSSLMNNVNTSCIYTTSNLNPYVKPFESKTFYASNSSGSGFSGIRDAGVADQSAFSASPKLVVSQQNTVSGYDINSTVSESANVYARTQGPCHASSHSAYGSLNTHFTNPPTLKVEPPCFNGNPAEYYSFIKAFDTLIDRPLLDPNRKLFFLLHYTKDIAHSLIKGCQHMPSDRGYKEARNLLQSYFGQKHKIIEACMRPILKGPVLSERDQRGIIKFSADLTSCLYTLEGMDCLDRMDNMDVVSKIANRLPPTWIPNWYHESDQIMHVQHKDICVKDLCEFVRRKTREGTNFLQIPTAFKSSGLQQRPPTRIAKTFSTQAQSGRPSPKCPLCADNHFLNQCSDFRALSYKGRVEFVNEQKLCRACLKVGHIATKCNRRNEACKKHGCREPHTTLLHPPEEDKQKPAAATKAPIQNKEANGAHKDSTQIVSSGLINLPKHGRSLLPVVPVKIRVGGCAEAVVTKALLDTGSTHSFITESLTKELGIKDYEEVDICTVTLNQNKEYQRTKVVRNLEILDFDEISSIALNSPYSCKQLPVSDKDAPTQADVDQYSEFKEVYIPKVESRVGLLIGNDNRLVLQPQEVVKEPSGSYAVRTVVGWAVNCPGSGSKEVKNFFLKSSTEVNPMCSLCIDVVDSLVNEKKEPSVDQQRFIASVTESTKLLEEQHYEIGLPVKNPDLKMPNNRIQAVQRATYLKKRFQRDSHFRDDYNKFINDMIDEGYCEKVESPGPESRTWYLPHHGVYHPEKPGKIRVVFDCSAKFDGVSLNANLLQGPDLTNSLIGVLLRFRREGVAIQADIKSMFHQVRIPTEDRDLLRFLWWKEGDIDQDIEEYRMNVFPFGTVSSPSCANFALKRTASDNEQEFSTRAVETVKRDFYVDDCLTSTPTVESAKQLVYELRSLLAKGGFRLNKWISNSREVMNSIPKPEWSKEALNLDLASDELPTERALGLYWNVEKDSLAFRVKIKPKPYTRRGILSVINSIYDPLGFGVVVVLPMKVLLQGLCRHNLGWDDPISPTDERRWKTWLEQLPLLKDFTLARCHKPPMFGKIVHAQLHHFADASETAYGSVSYLRLVNEAGEVHCSLLFGKSRLAPLKPLTIPRLELCAAVVAAQNDAVLRKELQISELEECSVFWSDSATVLRYLQNESKSFHTFVANRVQKIKNVCEPSHWHHVPSKENPADLLTRGLTVNEFLECDLWKNGPAFLWKSSDNWPRPLKGLGMPDLTDDPEVRKDCVLTYAVEVKTNSLEELFRRYSDWHKLKRVCAWVIRFKNIWRGRSTLRFDNLLTLDELNEAERLIFSHVQLQHYGKEIYTLQTAKEVLPSSHLRKLDPFLENGLLRVGGRLEKSHLPYESKHQILLPKCHVSELIITAKHRELGHTGRLQVIANLRETLWITNVNALARTVLSKCVKCRKIRGLANTQKMANLPEERLIPGKPPFSFVGVDCFGPFLVKQGRSELKRYGVLFTCFTTRAVHIEVAHCLDTSSFIQSLRRFMARRGQVEELRSDNGSNFVGAERELTKAITSWNQSQINNFLLQRNTKWKFNVPRASHHGGVWERLIRSVRKILSGICSQQVLTDEGLLTLMCEVENILNNRPLTTQSSDPSDFEVLTPNHLLLLKQRVPLPPGIFSETDNYARRRWRQVQYLANVFWKRWISEYLPLLQKRSKWHSKTRNISQGDIVLVMDQTPRNLWIMGRVIETFPDKHGLVRSAKIQTQFSVCNRPISKLCTLLEVESAVQ